MRLGKLVLPLIPIVLVGGTVGSLILQAFSDSQKPKYVMVSNPTKNNSSFKDFLPFIAVAAIILFIIMVMK